MADALSRLHKNEQGNPQHDDAQLMATTMCVLTQDESVSIPSAKDLHAMAQAYAALTTDNKSEAFPMRPALIAEEQGKDKSLQHSFNKNPERYGSRTLEGVELVTYDDKIVIPRNLQGRIVAWYHEYLAHPGQTRTEQTLKAEEQP